MTWIKAKTAAGQPISVRKLDKTTWHLRGTGNGAEIEYEIFADQSGPFGAQLSSQHAFFNLAEILMYPVDGRNSPAEIRSPTCLRVGGLRLPSRRRARAFRHKTMIAWLILQSNSVCFRNPTSTRAVVTTVWLWTRDPSDYDMQTNRSHAPQPGFRSHYLDG